MGAARRLALALLLALAALAAPAQEASPDYAAWETLATRTEAALAGRGAPDGVLEELRAQIATAREAFLAAQDANAARIATVEGQIDALGPPPAEGEEEPEEIADRRADLNERLARLRSPGRTAEEAFTRASGLVAEIDRTLRQRQARALLAFGPSPLNPAHWPHAAEALRQAGHALAAEPRAALAEPDGWDRLRARLPIVLGLSIAGLAMIARARSWMSPLMRYAEARLPSRAQGAGVFALSTGQIVLPIVGALLIGAAARTSGLFGPAGEAVTEGLALAALQYFGARWIGSWLFPHGERWNLTLGLPPRSRVEGRAYTALLGAVLALGGFLAPMADLRDWSEATRIVLGFPLLVAIGLMLFRLGQLLARHAGHAEAAPSQADQATDAPGETAADGYAGPLLRNAGRATMGVGAVGPVLAAVGYARLAEALLIPTVLSLALVGLLVIFQQLVRDLYALLARRDDGARDALLPVLLGFALGIASLPVFALIWGARASDLTEIWARVRAGVRVGDTLISPGAIVSFALILAIGVALTRLVQGALRSQVLPRTTITPGGRTALVSGVGYVGFILAGLVAITGAGLDLSSLAIVAGALSVGIGFGLQNVVNNFVSGIILLIERPISEGDWIEVGGQMGYVRSISVRSTRIETFDRTDVIVPNADLISGTVTNWTHGNLIGRLILPVGVAYGSDVKRVDRILREIAEAHPMVLLKPPPSILFRRFGADALEFEVRAILRDVNWVLSVENDLNHEIARRFAEAGIEIPHAQRDLWLRNPEALRDALRAGEGAPSRDDGPDVAPDDARAGGRGDVVESWRPRRDDAARG